jgi:NADH:ubiquinone oxidoreductase subunit 2 (subunit N)
VALALFGSLVSLYYYLIVLKATFLDEPAASSPVVEPYEFEGRTDFLLKITLVVLAGAVLLLGLLPGLLVTRILTSLG